MAMHAIEIERLIKAGLPDAEVTIKDLKGDGNHYEAHVASRLFLGKTRVQQHKLVYDALGGRMGGVLHALALKTAIRPIPGEAAMPSDEGKTVMSEQQTHDLIRKEIISNDIVLFMKGTKHSPQCGFSSQVAQILGHLGVDYKDINVLEDPSLRDGVKSYANWPTIPQLYVKGEFVGGCDIVREMFQAGELQDLLTQEGVPTSGPPATG